MDKNIANVDETTRIPTCCSCSNWSQVKIIDAYVSPLVQSGNKISSGFPHCQLKLFTKKNNIRINGTSKG